MNHDFFKNIIENEFPELHEHVVSGINNLGGDNNAIAYFCYMLSVFGFDINTFDGRLIIQREKFIEWLRNNRNMVMFKLL